MSGQPFYPVSVSRRYRLLRHPSHVGRVATRLISSRARVTSPKPGVCPALCIAYDGGTNNEILRDLYGLAHHLSSRPSEDGAASRDWLPQELFDLTAGSRVQYRPGLPSSSPSPCNTPAPRPIFLRTFELFFIYLVDAGYCLAKAATASKPSTLPV